ncbi:MAG: hypothetical protein R2762_11535 [Bryobacteraceae bacterium]
MRRCFLLAATLALGAGAAASQTCRLSVAGLNRERRAMGDIAAECPGNPLHTAPFGNWGVSSNFGSPRDSHQFDGWCHDVRVCDNNNRCSNVCGDGWYEWNSCTTDPAYRAPNCDLFNDASCTAQRSTTGINVHGTVTVEIPVRCPIDSNGDGVADAGGCADLATYTHSRNFMSLYELDRFTGNDLVQTLYFPPTPVRLRCTVSGCEPAGSEWVAPEAYDSPASPPKAFAEMATVVNSGQFVAANGACRLLLSLARTVSAASFEPAVAADSLASMFGANLAAVTAAAEPGPLPTTLGGVSTVITDASGMRAQARLVYVSPSQINFAVPAGLAVGDAALAVESSQGTRAVGGLRIEAVAPAVFAASGDGRGRPAALVVRGLPGGGQEVRTATEPVTIAGSAPILVLFGTGMRGRAGPLEARLGGVKAEVLYAGPQPEFAGLDQVNVRIPAELAGRGEVDIRISVDGKPANVLTLLVR